MNKRLTKGLSEDRKQEFKDFLKYNDLFEAVRDILREDLNACQRDRRSLKSTLTQSYSVYQADRNATERTLLKVLDLIKQDDKS
jgi:hypothetical protein